jgi:putative acyl-CoA dehydrogenase
LVFQGSLLVRHAPGFVTDAFCASRLAGDSSHAFGTMPSGIDTRSIIDRARPTVASS